MMPTYQLNLPLIIFIAATFLLQLMEVGKSTNLIVSGFFAFFSLGVISALVSQRYQQKVNLKKVHLYNGILGVLVVLNIGNGIIHWYKLMPLTIRTSIFFVLLLIFLIVLLRAIRLLNASIKSAK
jgi:hypothetical protein